LTDADHGVHVFTDGVTLKTVCFGIQAVAVCDEANGLSDFIVIFVNAAAADSLTLSGPGCTTAGRAFTETVTAFDQYGNIATGYTGTVSFASMMAKPCCRSQNYTFAVDDYGVHVFCRDFRLKTSVTAAKR